jgi:YhcH/YjgK/YiaL family protein
MILDLLSNTPLYEGFHPSFPKAFAWLTAFDPAMADGKYEIDGPGLVAIVQRYETAPKESKKWETHRVHGDIQVIYSGQEFIGYARRDELTIMTPYLPEKDAEFYEPPSAPAPHLLLPAGSFAVFLPQDAHQPGVMINQPESILKVVVKFRL